jgi:hypothetical protein
MFLIHKYSLFHINFIFDVHSCQNDLCKYIHYCCESNYLIAI